MEPGILKILGPFLDQIFEKQVLQGMAMELQLAPIMDSIILNIRNLLKAPLALSAQN